jgi:hypothetical protein
MVRRLAFFGLALALALPAARGRDEPKQDKPDKSPETAKEKYDALLKDFNAERQKALTAIRTTKGEEQVQASQKYQALGKDYAGKFYKLAEDNPKDPVATDAYFWIVQNAPTESDKAREKVAGLISEMPLADLNRRLPLMLPTNAEIVAAVVKRAEREEKDPQAANLLAWAAGSRNYPGATNASVDRAIDLLAERYPENPAVERLCQTLARSRNPKDLDILKKIYEKVSKDRVKAEASFAIGQKLEAELEKVADDKEKADKLAAEADQYLARAVELFNKEKLEARKTAAEAELKSFRTIRIGKEAPEIAGKDLDGQDFKLSDYRGKVVLLDFWGNW